MKGLVIGMGRTGLSITRHWRRLGYTVDATDSRPRPPAAESFSGHCDGIWCDEDFTRWPRQRFDGYDAVAVSPGVAPSQLPLPRSRLTNDVALFDSHWRRHGAADTRLLAVTGTNGKSTVTALAAHLARRGGVQAEAIGNLGEPMLDALLRWRDAPPPSLIVAELSSFQLEIAGRFHSDAAVVLNLSEDHLDRHGTLQRYGDNQTAALPPHPPSRHQLGRPDSRLMAATIGRATRPSSACRQPTATPTGISPPAQYKPPIFPFHCATCRPPPPPNRAAYWRRWRCCPSPPSP